MTFLARKSDDLHHFCTRWSVARWKQNCDTTLAGRLENYHGASPVSSLRCRNHSADHPVRVAREHDKTENQNHVQYQRDYQGGEHHDSSPRGSAQCRVLGLRILVKVALLSRGLVPWAEHCSRMWISRSKSTEQACGTPNRCSVHASPTSQERCGRQKQLLKSQQLLAVASALRNSISPATAIGPATRLQPSFPKFSSAIRCATYE